MPWELDRQVAEVWPPVDCENETQVLLLRFSRPEPSGPLQELGGGGGNLGGCSLMTVLLNAVCRIGPRARPELVGLWDWHQTVPLPLELADEPLAAEKR